MNLRRSLLLAVVLIGAAAPAPAQERLQPSELHYKLVDLLIEKPDTSLTEAAEYANSLLPQYGLDYLLDAQFWLEAKGLEENEPSDPKASTDIPLKSGNRTFIGEIQGREYTGACLERWLELPAINVTTETFEIIHRGEQIAVERPSRVLVEHMKVLSPDQQTVLADVFIPQQNGPAGVSADGRGVLLTYPLATGTRPWWSNVQRQYPMTDGKYPYLLLEVRAEGIRFLTEPEAYEPTDAEWLSSFPTPPDNAYLRRWRFPKSGYVVEFTGPCT